MQESERKSLELDYSSASGEAISLMMDETADDGVFSDILSATKLKPGIVKMLYEHPRTPDDVRRQAALILRVPVLAQSQVQKLKDRDLAARVQVQEVVKRDSVSKRMQRLSIGEKIKMAQIGNKEVRGVLLRDTNKLVVLTALGNPKITDTEVEAVARNRSTMDEALRIVIKNKEWMKSYTIMTAIVNNPKTPPTLAMKYIKHLKKKDIKMLSHNKNVPDLIRITADRLVKKRAG